MEQQLIESLVAGGPVALLAGMIFLVYAKDKKSTEEQLRKDRSDTETRLSQFIEADQRTREANTKVLADLAAATRESTAATREGTGVMQEVKALLRTQIRGGSDGESV